MSEKCCYCGAPAGWRRKDALTPLCGACKSDDSVPITPLECETCEGPCDREKLADFLTPVPDLDYGAKGTDYRPVPAPLPDLPDEHLDYPRPRPSSIDPSHYRAHPSGVECIQIAEHMGFCLGNAVKYIWRAGLKSSDPKEDLEKAIWYLKREIARLNPHG